MTPPLRKTLDGIEFSHGLLRTAGAAIALGAALWVGARQLVHKTDAIDAAVPRVEFLDTARAIRSDLSGVMARVDETGQQLLGLNCAKSGYPSPFCDGITRPIRAVRIR